VSSVSAQAARAARVAMAAGDPFWSIVAESQIDILEVWWKAEVKARNHEAA